MQYDSIMLDHDIEYFTQIIQKNEAFLCLYNPTILIDGPPILFFLVKNAHKGYYKIDIVCNGNYGTQKCGQCGVLPVQVVRQQHKTLCQCASTAPGQTC